MEVKIIKCDINWKEIKNLCRTTMGKGDTDSEPSDKWKLDLLISEHSPIRHSQITVEITDIEYWVVNHFTRHSVGVTPYVQTSRSDRTGVPRSERRQTDLVNMKLDLNIQSLINISKKRLCHQASDETRLVWERVIEELYKVEPLVAYVCVPECFKSGGCTEMKPCGLYDGLTKNATMEEQKKLVKRYKYYNRKFGREYDE